jgi:hypothetical protein
MEERRTKPATAADFHRLADLAHERGLQLFRDGSRWYCSSASKPGESHYVTGFSCTCPGFVSHQRCTHHALLLERLGWLPEVESVENDLGGKKLPEVASGSHFDAGNTAVSGKFLPPLADCPDCSGCGLQSFPGYALPCETCNGSGVKPSHHLHDAPAPPMVATAA